MCVNGGILYVWERFSKWNLERHSTKTSIRKWQDYVYIQCEYNNVPLQEPNISQTKPASGDQDSAHIMQPAYHGNVWEAGTDIHMLTNTHKQQLDKQGTIREANSYEGGIRARYDIQSISLHVALTDL